jgi:hypothetical protein
MGELVIYGNYESVDIVSLWEEVWETEHHEKGCQCARCHWFFNVVLKVLRHEAREAKPDK